MRTTCRASGRALPTAHVRRRQSPRNSPGGLDADSIYHLCLTTPRTTTEYAGQQSRCLMTLLQVRAIQMATITVSDRV
jgi:hypothetical protein